MNHIGGQITIKTEQGTSQSIALSPTVRVRSIFGAFGANKQVMPITALIPGFPVTVEADDSSGRLIANEIDYKKSEHKTASQVQAGGRGNQATGGGDRPSRGRTPVRLFEAWAMGRPDREERLFQDRERDYFARGPANPDGTRSRGISDQRLCGSGPRLCRSAGKRQGQRAAKQPAGQAVINYLKQSGHLLPGRVLSASAMGEVYLQAVEAADNEAQANSRRVTVRVVTSAAHLDP